MNKLDILKSLLPGFLPLIVFIAADSIWGTQIGLAVAIVSGMLEIAWSWMREKFIDKFVLLDIGLITILGAVSIVLDNPIFFKLKPALIELIFCIIIAISVFSPVNVMLLMAKRYMKNIELNESAMSEMKRSLKSILFLFVFHTGLIIYSAFFMSKGAWAFISGGLFYILFAVYFVFEIFKKKLAAKKWAGKYKDDEWFDIVDSNGKVKGRAPRTLCHSGPGMLHPVVHLHLIDSKNRIYLQKRHMNKQIQPGKWDTAVGGHVASGEPLDAALMREAQEELGISEFKPVLIGRYVWETEVESELVYMFAAGYEKNIVFNRDEIEDGKYWKIKNIKTNLRKGIFTPNFELEFDILIKQVIK
jgi:isopentenyldiphosphate isomerase/intracellular septation protein A